MAVDEGAVDASTAKSGWETNPFFLRYQGRGVETEVAMPLIYLPLVIFSATMSLFLVTPSDRK